MDPYTQAALISGGADLLGGALGRQSSRSQRANLRTQYRYQERYTPSINSAIFRGRMSDANEHSIHPLVMAGIDPGGAGGFSGDLRGNNAIGDSISRAGRSVGMAKLEKARMQAEIDLLKAQANNLGQKPPSEPSPIPGQQIPVGVVPPIHHDTQELKKGEVTPYLKGERSTNMNVKSPFTTLRLGSQDVKFMVEDAEALLEDPVAAIASAYLYHGNKGVNWYEVVKDFYFGPGLPPAMVSEGTNRMFKRIKAEAAKRSKARRRKSNPDVFVPYSRGPHR